MLRLQSNPTMTSRRTAPGDDLTRMLNTLVPAFFVIERMGQGVNYVTGGHRAAPGFWFENGEIAYPVQEITIAGNLAICSRASRPWARRRHYVK